MFGLMGTVRQAPRPTPTWMSPGSAFHIKPRTWTWINGTEFTSFANFKNTPTAGVFSRPSEQYGLTSAGVFTRFASDVPAITDLGLLIEPSEDALDFYSKTPASWSSNTRVTITTSQAGAFDSSAILVTADGTSGSHSKGVGAASYTNGTSYLIYVIVEQLSSGYFQIVQASGAFGTQTYSNFDLSGNGAIGSKGTNVTSSGIAKLSTGRFLCWHIAPATATATGATTFAFIPASTSGRLASSTSTASCIISGYQVIAGASRWSSLIDTALTVPITRAKSSLTIKPAAGTYNITYRFGDGTADQTVNGVAITSDGYEIPTSLSGRFITDIIGVTA